MKGKILNKARLAGAVMLATAGMAAGTAQADSLLAPLAVDDTSWNTFFAFKMQGANGFAPGNRPTDPIHYTWIQKGTAWQHLMVDFVDLGPTAADNDDVAYGPKPCDTYDNFGRGTANDVVFQRARTGSVGGPPAPFVSNNVFINDNSVPNGFDNGTTAALAAGNSHFAGMVVIDDFLNTDTTGQGSAAPEGNMAGFAYLVNAGANLLLDYKLLNNHQRAVSGDFSIGFISKHVVDLMWVPDNNIGAVLNPIPNPNGNGSAGTLDTSNTTNWYAAVTGPDMANETNGYNSVYGLQVVLSTNQRGAGLVVNEVPGLALEDAPTNGFAQAYDNDERALSGDTPLTITCVGAFQRDDFLTGPQAASATNGGWARRSIIPLTDQFAGANTPKQATGAIVYRGDTFTNLFDNDVGATGAPSMTLQVETGGHLNPVANHANRPY